MIVARVVEGVSGHLIPRSGTRRVGARGAGATRSDLVGRLTEEDLELEIDVTFDVDSILCGAVVDKFEVDIHGVAVHLDQGFVDVHIGFSEDTSPFGFEFDDLVKEVDIFTIETFL